MEKLPVEEKIMTLTLLVAVSFLKLVVYFTLEVIYSTL